MKKINPAFRSMLLFVFALTLGFVGTTVSFAQDSRNAAMKRESSKKSKITRSKAITKKVKTSTLRQQTTGEPWQGEVGVTRTMAEIQAESDALGEAREPRKKRAIKKIRPDRRNLPQNEDSPEIAKFPIDPTTQPVRDSNQDAPQSPQTVSTNFNGGTLSDTLSFPPDTMGEIGPTQYIMAVNGWIRSFNKTTGAADGAMNVDMDVFFNSVRNGSSTSDPRIRYDRLSQRWIIIIINVANTNNRVLFAVSNSPNITPATVWTYYFFQINTVLPVGDNGCFADYPTLGVDANALYIGTNNFCPNNFAGSSGFVVRKSSILSGGPIVATAFRGIVPTGSSEGPYTPQGVDNFDPAATDGYFIGVSNAVFGRLILRRVSNPGTTPTISADIPLTVPSTAFAATVPHLGNTGGTAGNLDSLDDRLYAAHLRNGRIYTAHNIRVTATGTGSNAGDRTGSRWYEVENIATTPTLRQSGTWFDTTATNPKNFWIPSIMISGQGHIALGGSSAGVADSVNAATIGRLSTDALGTLQSSVIYTNSLTSYNPSGDPGGSGGRRWGDYSYTSIDPEDDMTMWTIQQWNQSNNSYAMRVAKLLAPPPATPASASPSTVNGGQSSVNVTITGTSSAGSGFFDPGAGFAKRLAASVSGTGVTVNSVTYTNPTTITLNLSTVGATAGQRNITITNPDGQAVTANNLITIQSGPAAGVKPQFDFDGDAKTDVAQFRGSAGTWFISRSSNGSFTSQGWGTSTDLITPADFDGDNKTDYAVFRPSNGTWFVIQSSNGAVRIFQWGSNGDKPAPGDYDGDNKADFAVFRNGTWFVSRSSDNQVTVQGWGSAGDIPVFGRYDTDNRDDFAVFRPSNGTWFILNSSNGAVGVTQWGANGDFPAVGDYDGDARYDLTVFRAGTWYVLQSSNGAARIVQWGSPNDVATPGDYDGDGKNDFGVFRPTDRNWYVQRSSNGSALVQFFGLADDKPVPSAYTR